MEVCKWGVCFFSLDPSGPKIFGFSEYLASLALMVLAWTIADTRYKFRVSVAPIPLMQATFWIVLVVGILALLTDVWRSQAWLVPKGNFINPVIWQAMLGGTFLFCFLSWAFFAFIHPPKFSKFNCEIYLSVLYRYLIKGSPTELPVLADELDRSVAAIIRLAPEEHEMFEWERRQSGTPDRVRKKLPKKTECANEILLLIADRKFCKSIIDHSVVTAYRIFYEIGVQKKYRVSVQQLARNLTSVAVLNKDSFIYHETHGYESGLLGYIKPVSQAMYANHAMVEVTNSLDIRYDEVKEFDAENLKAYLRISELCFQNYCQSGLRNRSYTLNRVFENIKRCCFDLYKLDGVETGAYQTDIFDRFGLSCNFIKTIFDSLIEFPVEGVRKTKRIEENRLGDIYDSIAELIFDLAFYAGSIRSGKDLTWVVQHNTYWGDIFGHYSRMSSKKSDEISLILFRLRRLIYDEIVRLEEWPQYKGAKYLALCLNVMRFEKESYLYKEEKPLYKAVISWTVKHFSTLYRTDKDVAEACLVEGLSYDEANNRLIRENKPLGSKRVRGYSYLELNE